MHANCIHYFLQKDQANHDELFIDELIIVYTPVNTVDVMLHALILLYSHNLCAGGCLHLIGQHHWSTPDSSNQKKEENGADIVSLFNSCTHTLHLQSLSKTYNYSCRTCI